MSKLTDTQIAQTAIGEWRAGDVHAAAKTAAGVKGDVARSVRAKLDQIAGEAARTPKKAPKKKDGQK